MTSLRRSARAMARSPGRLLIRPHLMPGWVASTSKNPCTTEESNTS